MFLCCVYLCETQEHVYSETQDTLSLEQLVQKHNDYWNSLHCINLHFNVVFKHDNEVTLKQIDGIWQKYDNKERICYSWEAASGVEFHDNNKRIDYFFDGVDSYLYEDQREMYRQNNKNFCLPRKDFSGRIVRENKNPMIRSPILVQTFILPDQSTSQPLDMIVKNYFVKSIKQLSDSSNDQQLYQIEITHEEEKNPKIRWSAVLTINGTKNFLIESCELTNCKEKYTIKTVFQVQDYVQYATNCWFPKKIQTQSTYDINEHISTTEVTIESVEIADSLASVKNEPFTFPYNSLVSETDSQGKVLSVHRWGLDKPLATFDKEGEFESYFEKYCAGNSKKIVRTPFPKTRAGMFGIRKIKR
jgi:hypothetical protein